MDSEKQTILNSAKNYIKIISEEIDLAKGALEVAENKLDDLKSMVRLLEEK